jgi:hypothetical protein
MVHGCKVFLLLTGGVLTSTKIAALKGYEDANGIALDLWTQVYSSSLLVALTDTFSTDVFFRVNPSIIVL